MTINRICKLQSSFICGIEKKNILRIVMNCQKILCVFEVFNRGLKAQLVVACFYYLTSLYGIVAYLELVGLAQFLKVFYDNQRNVLFPLKSNR